jgi:hypothetical protein
MPQRTVACRRWVNNLARGWVNYLAQIPLAWVNNLAQGWVNYLAQSAFSWLVCLAHDKRLKQRPDVIRGCIKEPGCYTF